jgi:hypothetical protein
MMPVPDPAKTMGASVPTFLVLLAVCWLCMLGTMATWIGRTPVPGRETDRMIAQAYSGGFALLVWIFLAALLLIASSKEVMPVQAGVLAWFIHPVSCAAALAAIAALFHPQRYWQAAIPVLLPLLIAGYVLYTFYPSVQTIPVTNAAFAMWAVVVVLSLTVVPAALALLPARGEGSIEDKPGPEMDRFMDKQRQRYRDDVLDKLRQSDDETRLYEVTNLIQPDNPALKEVLDFIHKMPNRQADAVMMLGQQGEDIIRVLPDLDLQPTPEFCTAARRYLHEAVLHRRASLVGGPNTFVGIEFSGGIDGIRWIAKNCGCKKELDEMEAYARDQQQDAPEVQKFLAALAEMKEAK